MLSSMRKGLFTRKHEHVFNSFAFTEPKAAQVLSLFTLSSSRRAS